MKKNSTSFELSIKFSVVLYILFLGFKLNATSDNNNNCALQIAHEKVMLRYAKFVEMDKQLLENAKQLKDVDQKFAYEMRNSQQTVAPLKIEANKIKDIIEILPHDGQSAAWMLKVITEDNETKILKIYDHQDHHILENYSGIAVIQKTLAEHGFIPKLTGLLTDIEIRKLYEKFPNKLKEEVDWEDRSLPTFGILMDFAEGDFIKDSDDISDETLSKLEVESFTNYLEQQVSSIENLMSKLRVIPFDVQVIINSSGRLQLIDLDYYEYISLGGIINHSFFEFEQGASLSELLENGSYVSDISETEYNIQITESGKYTVILSDLRETLKLKPRSHDSFNEN